MQSKTKLGTFLKATRESKGLSIQELAALTNVSAMDLENLEIGENAQNFPLRDLHLILASMKATEEDLIEFSLQLGRLSETAKKNLEVVI